MSDTNGGFSSLFTDPTLMGMLGAAGAFGQAAMPSRLPVPMGAALGLAAGGLAQGGRAAYGSQIAEQQAQAGGMQNLLTASSLPMALARNQMLTRIYQNPQLLQQMMSGSGALPSGAGAPGLTPSATGAGTPGDVSKTALASLPDDATRTMAVNAALRAGLPQEAWAPWVAAVGNESGWHMNVPDGSAGEVGPGQVLPTTGQGLGYTTQQLRDPGTNLLASARYFGQKWQEAKGDPAGAFAGYNAGSVTGNPTAGYVPAAMSRLAGYGYAGAAPSSPGTQVTPQNALLLAQGYEQRANQVEAMKSIGLPVMGDPAALRTAAQQYRTLALAAPTAQAQESAKAQYAGPIAAATAAAEAANKPFNDRFGNVFIGDGRGGFRYLGRGPEVRQVWDPVRQQMVWGDVGGIGVGALPGTAEAASASGPQATGALAPAPLAAEPNPLQKEFMTERGKDLSEQFQKIDEDAASAKEGNYLFDNLRRDSATWQMGKFADVEGDARAWLSAIANQFGISAPGLDQKLADFQAFNKSSGMLLRTAVHDTSSRAAVQEYKLIGETLPQPTTSQQGFGQIADQWQGLNDFRLAKQKFAAGYQAHPEEMNVEFNTQVSPVSFMLNRMSQTPQGQSDMQAMLSRMQQTPEGRNAASHMLDQFKYARQRNLFDGLPPIGGGQ